MKALRYVLSGFLILVLLGTIAGAVYIRYNARKGIPDYSMDISVPGLTAKVSVVRDSMAVPHVFAENEMDLYRCVGYLQAQDRLWQMDLLRRLTQGRLAEIFGKDLVEADQLFRSLHFSDKSKMVMDSCQSEIIDILNAYTAGVNDFINDNPGKLPPEFSILGYKPEKWEPFHSVNLIGYMSWGLTMGWSTEVILFNISQVVDREHFLELVPDMDMQKVYVIPDEICIGELALNNALYRVGNKISEMGLQVFQASNNWVISAERSEDGHAMLANDMHLELNAPGIWYQMQQTVPGKLNVTGVVLPGQPFVICGHNDRVAWGMTNVMVDDMDFYLETIHKEDSLKYLLDGKWMDIRVEKETIFTKEGDSITLYNQFTHRGPIISKFKNIKDKTLSMRWIGNEYSNELRSVYLFDRMNNWEDFKNAAKTFISISENIAYADVDNNIGMYVAAGIPIREGEGIFIVPGDTSQYDWKGIVAFDELPNSYNPPNGFIASANNRTTGDDYPYYISRWYDLPNRMERIVEKINSKDKIGLKDMIAIQSDQKSLWAKKLVPYFKSILEPELVKADSIERKSASLLFNWDYEMGKESIEPTIFEQFYFEFIHNLFADELGEELYKQYVSQNLLSEYVIDKIRISNESIWFDDINTAEIKETPGDIALKSLKDATQVLKDKLGKDMAKWQWGKIHSFSLKHPLGSVDVLASAFKLNRGPFPVGGSYHTVSPFSFPSNDRFHSNFGSSHRHIYLTENWNNSLVILPTGISGIPASKHYCDQTDEFLQYKYKRDYFSPELISKNALYRMSFVPE